MSRKNSKDNVGALSMTEDSQSFKTANTKKVRKKPGRKAETYLVQPPEYLLIETIETIEEEKAVPARAGNLNAIKINSLVSQPSNNDSLDMEL